MERVLFALRSLGEGNVVHTCACQHDSESHHHGGEGEHPFNNNIIGIVHMFLAVFRDVPKAKIKQLFLKNKFLLNLFIKILQSLNSCFYNGMRFENTKTFRKVSF